MIVASSGELKTGFACLVGFNSGVAVRLPPPTIELGRNWPPGLLLGGVTRPPPSELNPGLDWLPGGLEIACSAVEIELDCPVPLVPRAAAQHPDIMPRRRGQSILIHLSTNMNLEGTHCDPIAAFDWDNLDLAIC